MLWAILLSLSILGSQGVKLHVHDTAHDHGNQHHDQLDTGYSDHVHPSEFHFANDQSHIDHHVGDISELDISPDGLLKKLSSSVLTLAFLAACVLLLQPRRVGQTWLHRREPKFKLVNRYLQSPPLRAPPLS